MEKLVASDADNGDRFGQAVAIDGDVVVSGAFRADDLGLSSGSTYVYRFDGASWVEEVELHASDGAGGDRFGWSVDVSGDRLIVGAREDDDGGSNSGSAYVFHFDGVAWSEEAKLTASDAQADDEFGFWVAIDGDVAVVGASGEDSGGSEAGAAYVFRRSGSSWSQEAKLTALDAAAGDGFGLNVDVRGDLVAVGADLESAAGSSAGAAYVFRHSGGAWTQEIKLMPPSPGANDRFGYAVSIGVDTLLVGSMNDDAPASSSGSAFVYRYDGTWSLEQQLVASDASFADFFGWAVCLDGDVAVVGARLEDEGGSDSGAAYVYRYDSSTSTWGQEGKFVGSDTASGDSFAYALGAQGDRIVCGAWSDEDAGSDTGSAYVFTGARFQDCNSNGVADACDIFTGSSLDSNGDGLPDECSAGTPFCFGSLGTCPCGNGAGAIEGCANSAGVGAFLYTTGTGSVSLDDFGLECVQLPPNKPSLAFSGETMVSLSFGDGIRCVGGPIQRLYVVSSDGSGFAAWPPSLSAQGGWTSGDTRWLQIWYRDAMGSPCGGGFNVSSGVEVEFVP